MGNVFDLPENHPMRVAHKKSIYHRREIEQSSLCGCFYCCQIFKPDEIEHWTDSSKPQAEQTALCPHCGIDSVIGDQSGFDIAKEFLAEMHKHWFED